MKHSICGFNHASLVLNYKLDYDDAQIIRCIIDFRDTGKMKTLITGKKQYFWVSYKWLSEELVALPCKNKRSVARRMQKYVDCGLMESYLDGGKFTFYRFVESSLNNLVSFPQQEATLPALKSTGHLYSKVHLPVLQSTPTCTPEYGSPVLQSTPIDPSIKDQSIRNKEYLQIAELLRDKINDQGTGMLIKPEHLLKWCNTFRLMVERDGRSETQIRSKIDSVFKDSFWSGVIRSADTLRLRWNEGKLDRLKESQGESSDDDERPGPYTPSKEEKLRELIDYAIRTCGGSREEAEEVLTTRGMPKEKAVELISIEFQKKYGKL